MGKQGDWLLRTDVLRRPIGAVGLAAALLHVLAKPALAADGPAAVAVDILTWASKSPPDWVSAGVFAFLGFLGSAATMFFLVGGSVPGTAGQAGIEADQVQYDRWSRRLDELMGKDAVDAAQLKQVSETVDRLRDDLRREKRAQYGLAAVLYVVLGTGFAVALAQGPLQALAIGAGWTSFLGTLGLKSDFAKRKEVKDAALEQVLTSLREVEGQPPPPPPVVLTIDANRLRPEAVSDVQAKVREAHEAAFRLAPETLARQPWQGSLTSDEYDALEREVRAAQRL